MHHEWTIQEVGEGQFQVSCPTKKSAPSKLPSKVGPEKLFEAPLIEADAERYAQVRTKPSDDTPPASAVELLQQAADCIGNRASERDQPDGERSMARTVTAFNALCGTSLSEVDGWLFMAVLKAARAKGGAIKMDDYVDGAAYFALAGEAACR